MAQDETPRQRMLDAGDRLCGVLGAPPVRPPDGADGVAETQLFVAGVLDAVAAAVERMTVSRTPEQERKS